MAEQPTETRSRIINKAMQDQAFKRELMSNPKAVIARESGQKWPDSVDIEVLEQTPNKLYFLLPLDVSTASQGELSEEQLEAVAGGIAPIIVAAAITGAAQIASAIID